MAGDPGAAGMRWLWALVAAPVLSVAVPSHKPTREWGALPQPSSPPHEPALCEGATAAVPGAGAGAVK
jgi:hypothetical protein